MTGAQAHPPGRRRLLGALAAAVCAAPGLGCTHATPAADAAATVDETWTDRARQRELPVRVRWPGSGPGASAAGLPVVLFSHGLGGTRAGGERWGQAWAAGGLVVVHLQHPGSDLDAVRGTGTGFTDLAALRRLGSAAQLLARLQDVTFVLDELARRQAAGRGRWARIRPQGVGLAGHSFGAHTTLGMAGQQYPGYAGVTEPRLAAFVALSPTLPLAGDAQQAFARLTRPLLCITGTRDTDVLGVGATPERRMGVFAALPPGRKAQLVLQDADHMTFGGQTGAATEIVRRSDAARNLQPGHHEQVARISTDWWRAWLMGDEAAQARLQRPGGLTADDRWQLG